MLNSPPFRNPSDHQAPILRDDLSFPFGPTGTSPLSLSRFPLEIQSMILSNIESLGKSHQVKMMCTSSSMYERFGPILYNRLDVHECNAKKIFYGLIHYQIPGTPRFLPNPEEGKDLDFALLSSSRIQAHQRKIWLLQHVRHLTLWDPIAVRNTALAIFAVKSVTLEEGIYGFEEPDLLILSRLQTLCLKKACVASLSSRYISSILRHHQSLIKATNGQLDSENICVTLRRPTEDLFNYRSLTDLCSSRRFSKRSVTIHQASYLLGINTLANSETRLIFKSCSCSSCARNDPSIDTYGESPFTISNLEEMIDWHLSEYTRTWDSQWSLSLYNLPQCVLQSSWNEIETRVRSRIIVKGVSISAVKTERFLNRWSKRYESWKAPQEIEPCVCCGQKL